MASCHRFALIGHLRPDVALLEADAMHHVGPIQCRSSSTPANFHREGCCVFYARDFEHKYRGSRSEKEIQMVRMVGLMAAQEVSLTCPGCSGLHRRKYMAFSSRPKPSRRRSLQPHASQQAHEGNWPSAIAAPQHVQDVMTSVAKAVTAVACSTLLAVSGTFHRLLRSQSSNMPCTASSCILNAIFLPGAHARLEGVNKPELLPDTFTTVIDVAGFLTPGEVSLPRTNGCT